MKKRIPSSYLVELLDLESPLTSEFGVDEKGQLTGEQRYETLSRQTISRGGELLYGRPTKENIVSIPLKDGRISRKQGIIRLLDQGQDLLPGVVLRDIGLNGPTKICLKQQDSNDNIYVRQNRLIHKQDTILYPGESVTYLDKYCLSISELE